MRIIYMYYWQIFPIWYNINDNDYVITLGTKGNSFFTKRNYKVCLKIEEETTGHEQEISKQIARKSLEMFTNNKIGEVHVIYTKFVNSLTFTAVDLLLVQLVKIHFLHSH